MKRKVMSKSNRIFYIVNTVLLMICLLLVAMPILNVVASSLSSPSAVIRGQVSFWPKGWNIDCLLYTSPSPRDSQKSRMPSSA